MNITNCIIILYSIVLPPAVNITPVEVNTTTGKSAKFVCNATGVGADGFTFQWFSNRKPVTGGNTSILLISDVSVYKTGNYTCFVRNQHGDIGQSRMARLILLGSYVHKYSQFLKF